MLSVIDPGAPAEIAGYIINDHVARLSKAALKVLPVQSVLVPAFAESLSTAFQDRQEPIAN